MKGLKTTLEVALEFGKQTLKSEVIFLLYSSVLLYANISSHIIINCLFLSADIRATPIYYNLLKKPKIKVATGPFKNNCTFL